MTGVPLQGGWAIDDEPLDLVAVAADDAAVEALIAGSPEGGDLALLLMRELLGDVGVEPPSSTLSSPAAPWLVEGAPHRARRAARRGAVVAALAAGVLSLGGAAAAAGLAPSDGPLRGVGEAVRAAAGAVIDAVSSEADSSEAHKDLAPAVARPPLPEPAATTATTARSEPGAAAAVARAAGAERAVTSLLDGAAQHLAAGRPGPAAAMLDTAGRRLPEVPMAERADLTRRLAALRAELAATVPAQTTDAPGRSRGSEPAAGLGHGRPAAPPSRSERASSR